IPHRNHGAYYTDAVTTVLPHETPRPAGFWIRAAALLVDFVIFYVAEHSFRFAAYRWWGDDVRDFDSGDATLVVRILADVFTLVFAGVYTTVLHTMDGQTIGKMLMGARVVGADGAPLPRGSAWLACRTATPTRRSGSVARDRARTCCFDSARRARRGRSPPCRWAPPSRRSRRRWPAPPSCSTPGSPSKSTSCSSRTGCARTVTSARRCRAW